jgi:hypothetical protein
MRKSLTLLIFALVLVCLSANMFAQINATATLQGTVTDKTGAVIPGADVKITNKQTGEVRSATTSGSGLYTFNLLPAGTYEVRVSVKGFSTAAFENVDLFVARTTTIDAQMSPSAQAETVTVEAERSGKPSAQRTRLRQPRVARSRRSSGELVRSHQAAHRRVCDQRIERTQRQRDGQRYR